ncbi:MAG: 5-oxoprolinase subunit PxpB [Clostridiales bacterium]|nr:5-oxoprolinase subunit PxpB [Clostridiales bacterium]
MKKFTVKPMGDSHLLVEFDDRISPRILDAVTMLCANSTPYFVQCITGYNTVLVQYDPLAMTMDEATNIICKYGALKKSRGKLQHKTHIVNVVYNGPDIQRVADKNEISIQDVIKLHTKRDYRVYMLGFLPGFCYLGGLHEKLNTPRLNTPRKHIPKGSVGIAGLQTGVYPLDSPGGWNIIGITDFDFFVKDDPPCPVGVGDKIIFKQVNCIGDQ